MTRKSKQYKPIGFMIDRIEDFFAMLEADENSRTAQRKHVQSVA